MRVQVISERNKGDADVCFLHTRYISSSPIISVQYCLFCWRYQSPCLLFIMSSPQYAKHATFSREQKI